jgi:hypothetical protein
MWLEVDGRIVSEWQVARLETVKIGPKSLNSCLDDMRN